MFSLVVRPHGFRPLSSRHACGPVEEQATAVFPSLDTDACGHVRTDDVEGLDCLDKQRKPDCGCVEASFVTVSSGVSPRY
jgi:hypothetical protein